MSVLILDELIISYSNSSNSITRVGNSEIDQQVDYLRNECEDC